LLVVDRGVGFSENSDRGLPGRPHGGVALTELGTLLRGSPTFGGLRIEVPPGTGACFDRLVVGSFKPA
jgi:hypothetical protein